MDDMEQNSKSPRCANKEINFPLVFGPDSRAAPSAAAGGGGTPQAKWERWQRKAWRRRLRLGVRPSPTDSSPLMSSKIYEKKEKSQKVQIFVSNFFDLDYRTVIERCDRVQNFPDS